MTFSIIGYCPATNAVGGAISTSNLAVGGRCVRLAHGCGAFLSQHRTDPRLGDVGLAVLETGGTAQDAIQAVVDSGQDLSWRQLGAIDRQGNFAAFHGQEIYSVYNHSAGKNCLALGNIIDNEMVTEAMRDTFVASNGETLAERLMRALEAGRDAGGEIYLPLRSATLRVTDDDGLDRCDLRVDAHDAPVAALRQIRDEFAGPEKMMRQLTLDPGSEPVNPAQKDKSIACIAERGLAERMPPRQRVINGTAAQEI